MVNEADQPTFLQSSCHSSFSTVADRFASPVRPNSFILLILSLNALGVLSKGPVLVYWDLRWGVAWQPETKLAGNEDTGLESTDLDKDFDPQKHDETMAQVLGEDRSRHVKNMLNMLCLFSTAGLIYRHVVFMWGL